MLGLKKRIMIFRFSSACKKVLKTDSKTYTGLFTSVWKISDGNTKRAEGVIREWHQRTINCHPSSPMGTLIEKLSAHVPDGEKIIADAILSVAKKVGIERDTQEKLCLDERTISAYTEWNGNELYEKDTVKVLQPAWYQNGTVIEQGHCELLETEEE